MQIKPKTMRFGVIADTHVPDREPHLPEALLSALHKAQVSRILHAGDASTWEVVRMLERIAPVTVVQGNRDVLLRMRTPHDAHLIANGVRIALTHGHRSMLNYLVDKWAYIKDGYRFDRYFQHLSQDFPDADVVIFGHTHHQEARWVDNQLFFNPGAAYPCEYNQFVPQYGILMMTSSGDIRTELHHL